MQLRKKEVWDKSEDLEESSELGLWSLTYIYYVLLNVL